MGVHNVVFKRMYISEIYVFNTHVSCDDVLDLVHYKILKIQDYVAQMYSLQTDFSVFV